FLVFTIADIGMKEHMVTSYSPDKSYKLDFYLINGGAMTPFSVAGELDGPLWFTKPIYYDYRSNEVDIEWENNYTVLINGYRLNLKKSETYSD
ncbi:MAG: DUF5412 family protein, partial [Bacillaceae bacterium]